MWKLATTVLVVLVTTFNAWMNWRLWQSRSVRPNSGPGPGLLDPMPSGKIRIIGQREIFRPQRTVLAARPPWSELESEDYAEYAGNLRRIGCPETTVRDILVADIEHALREQVRALRDESRDSFWSTGGQRDERERERTRLEWGLRLRKWALLRELFTYPADEEVLRIARDAAAGGVISLLVGFLEREDFIRAFGAMRYYTCQLEAVVSATEGILLESDYARAREVGAQMEATFTSLIGVGGVDELQLRMIAAQHEAALPTSEHGFMASGAELRQLMQIRRASRDLWSESIANTGFTDLKPAEVSDVEVETAVARFLGADRFADYLRAKDERYQGIHLFARENGLSKRDAVAVFEERVRAEDELKRLRETGDLSAEEKVLLQAAVKARVEATVRRVFGPVIGKEYLGDGSSSWIGDFITVHLAVEGRESEVKEAR
jgi:hypothetical protein